ncbi:ABC transporter substrate-binding protein [Inhella gelatinilytica]|uniref:ABC transporter substrate-binding protein n=1 Tax=Inhella gelatinilytica TaxID=2795030 RepID=A0A931NEC1_9BURK|nr:ABC transporter substrate-binding protein [Inhella gelatinilytica]MBH9553519.1 ABC transporter substrate-binding protein [Inhella gelatinilytica]
MNFHRTLMGLAVSLVLATSASSNTLRWAAQNDVLSLDPHSQNHNTTSAILQHAYEGLTRFGKDYKVEGALATDWKPVSPTQVRFTLRKGVKFHDGSPFTADDVVFSYQRISAPTSNMHAFVAGVKEVKKVDAHTVDFFLDRPDPILTRTLVGFRMMSKAWAEKNKAQTPPNFKAKEENFATRNTNGTGPYRITGWQPEQKLTMVQNKDWWDAKAASNVTEVIYSPIKNDQTRIAALLSGEVDLLTDVPTQDVARLKGDAKLKVVEGNEVRTIFLAMDQGSDQLKGSSVQGNPLKDKRVREALSLAIDRHGIQRAIMRGLSLPAATLLAPGVNGHNPQLDAAPKADAERAKKLMAEAGYPNGFDTPLNCPNNRYVNDEEICQAIVSMWARIGVRAKLQTESFASYSPKLQNFEFPLFLYGWGVNTFDALYSLQSLGHTRTAGADGNNNYWRLSDGRLDTLITDIKIEMEPVKRNALINSAQQRIKEETFFIPIHHQVRPWVMKPSVSSAHRADDKPEARFTQMGK